MNTLQILNQQEIIGIREFIKQLSTITSKPKKKLYTLVKNGKEVGYFIPAAFKNEVFADSFFAPENGKKKYKSVFDNYEKMAFSGGDPKLSQKIDEIVYGIGGKEK